MRGQVAALAFAILLGWLPVGLVIWQPPPLIGDEAYYARVPVEMRERGDWLMPHFNDEPRYKKPPLHYWLVAGSYRLFGENETTARLPSLLAVLLTAALLFGFGRQRGEAWTGALAATAFLLNPMTVLLGNWGAPEATLCLFVTAAVLTAFVSINDPSPWRWTTLSGVLAGLGVLTKGAPGIVLPFLTVIPLAIASRKSPFATRHSPFAVFFIGIWLVACLLIAAPWFIAVGLREGEKFWQVFLWREHFQRVATPMEGHRGPFWFYLPVAWLAFFPWSLRLPLAFWQAFRNFRHPFTAEQPPRPFSPFPRPIDKWMAWWALVVVAAFCVVVTKLPHYIFPAVPALAWLSARQWQRQATKGELVSIALLSLPVVAFIFMATISMNNAYLDLLKRTGFKPGEEYDWLKAAASLLTGGFGIASVMTLVASALFTVKRKDWLVGANALGAATVTAATLFSAFNLLHASGGHKVVSEWRKATAIVTFGSDTDWVVFYAKRPVPMFGDEPTLKRFLKTHPDAAVLARLDYAPKLQACGLTLQRFGIWVLARK